VDGIDAALEAGEMRVGDLAGVAEGRILIELEGAAHGPLPDLGVGPSQAAELPIVPDEAVDVMALLRGAGTESLEIFFGEGFEIGDVFTADDGGLRVDAGLQGILGRC
jgi:hypothetical protein